MRAPAFWDKNGVIPFLLEPAGWIYKLGGALSRKLIKGKAVGIPVVCVGNLVAGGAGKTPTALSLGAIFLEMGLHVAFLTRGYGGRALGPLVVDPSVHDAKDVGDEALLLACAAPTILSRDRFAGAVEAAASGAEVVVMDDGHQNPGLSKSLSVVVVDGAYGFGNGRTIPAGPLRESVLTGFERADALVLIGEDDNDVLREIPSGLPALRADIVEITNPNLPAGTRVLGFAGMGRPAKLRASLEKLGLVVEEFVTFADHHAYSVPEISLLLECAEARGALAVTTTKDHVRLPDELRERVQVIEIQLVWREPKNVRSILENVLGYDTG